MKFWTKSWFNKRDVQLAGMAFIEKNIEHFAVKVCKVFGFDLFLETIIAFV